MPSEITIESVMTAYPYSIELDAHVSSAKSMIAQYKIRHLPVKEGDVLVGVITMGDITRAEQCGIDTSISSNVLVQKLCNKHVYVVAPKELLVSVLKHMAENYIDVVLVAKNGKLIGIFTFTDALKRYSDLLSGK